MAQTILSLSQDLSLPFLPKPHHPQQLANCSSQASIFHLSLCLQLLPYFSLSPLLLFSACFSLSQPYAGLPILLSTSLQLFLVEKFGLSSVSAILYLLFIQSHNKSLVTSFILFSTGSGVLFLQEWVRGICFKRWTAINNCNFFLSLSQCPIDLKFCSLPHVTIR